MLGWNPKKTRRIRDLAGIVVKRHKKRTRRIKQPELAAPDNLLRPYYTFLDEAHPEKGYSFNALTRLAMKIWAQDFTYIRWRGRFYYLACVKELQTRRIVGWCLSLYHDADMVCTALADALGHHSPPNIIHHDRGSEYLSHKHAELCSKYHIAMSASAAGEPAENGFMESFFSSFKAEATELITTCQTETELHERIAAWIYYYNHIRIHTALKMPPADYAALLAAQSTQQLILSATLPR